MKQIYKKYIQEQDMTTVTQNKKEYTQDFPTLALQQPKKRCNKGIKIPLSELGFMSSMDTRESRNHSRHHSHRQGDEKRAEAYNQLKDRAAMANRLKNTRLCWSVREGKVCPHGKGKCHFAHSVGELCLGDCLFGDRCRFVFYREDKYHNSRNQNKLCTYLHPEETRENYMSRTGMDKIEIKTKTPPLKLEPTEIIIRPQTKSACLKSEEQNKSIENDDKSHAHFSVPKDLALDTLKAALEAGKTAVTITIL